MLLWPCNRSIVAIVKERKSRMKTSVVAEGASKRSAQAQRVVLVLSKVPGGQLQRVDAALACQGSQNAAQHGGKGRG